MNNNTAKSRYVFVDSLNDIKRQFNRARFIALAEREGLAVFGTRIQCPKKCSDDKRGVAVSESPNGALWSCHRCKAGGTVIDLLIATRGLSEKEVIMQLRSPEFMSNIPEPSRKLQTPKPIMDGAVLWNKLADRDSSTEEYLRSRGLGDAIPFVKFNAGNTEDYWLDLMARKGFRLAVPLRNKTGAVMDFQIRSICPLPTDKDGKTPSAKRSLRGSPRPRHTAFGRPDLIGSGKPIFITEGMADTLALQIAVPEVVGVPGCDQLRHIADLVIESGAVPSELEFILCPQNDSQAQSEDAFCALGVRLRELGCLVRELGTPELYKDPAEWIAGIGASEFTSMVREFVAAGSRVTPGGFGGSFDTEFISDQFPCGLSEPEWLREIPPPVDEMFVPVRLKAVEIPECDWVGEALPESGMDAAGEVANSDSEPQPAIGAANANRKPHGPGSQPMPAANTNRAVISHAVPATVANALPFPVESMEVKPTGKPRFNLTDLGNAARMAEDHKDTLRHCKGLGWHIWNNGNWVLDEIDRVTIFAAQSVKSIYNEAPTASEKLREKIEKWAHKSEFSPRINAMIDLAKSGLAVHPRDFDGDPWLFNCLNGTIDLRTGQLRPHNREDLITKMALVNYDPDAKCPKWDKYLKEVQPDPEVRTFLKRFIGYSLTGVIREHVFIVSWGKQGRNGKGVFQNTLLKLFNNYASMVPTDLLMEKRSEAHPTEKMVLLGSRLCFAAESDKDKALNVALVKLLTGGDPITARKMFQNFITFDPTHKLLLSTNNKPKIKETSNAIWQRIKLVSWNAEFPDDSSKTNKALKEELEEEFPGILNWAVDGYKEWREYGLNAPNAVKINTQEYRDSEDEVRRFIRTKCFLDENASVAVRELRECYEEWCQSKEEDIQRPMSSRAFNDQLESLRLNQASTREHGIPVRKWKGIGLLKIGRNDF